MEPELIRLTEKLPATDAFENSTASSLASTKLYVNALFGRDCGILIALVVLNSIGFRVSREKKYIGLMIVMINVSRFTPAETDSG